MTEHLDLLVKACKRQNLKVLNCGTMPLGVVILSAHKTTNIVHYMWCDRETKQVHDKVYFLEVIDTATPYSFIFEAMINNMSIHIGTLEQDKKKYDVLINPQIHYNDRQIRQIPGG